MGILGNLPAQMSPCLRTFIESQVDEIDLKRGSSWHENDKFQDGLPKIKKEEEFAHEMFQ
ncbi:MAG TPA: hypothetical protein VMG82_37050 [Candidatus Sulfotelmatobacter sp.]|nr:hypothetical protein [Candidatus Sulfotelmatobacter sp.]